MNIAQKLHENDEFLSDKALPMTFFLSFDPPTPMSVQTVSTHQRIHQRASPGRLVNMQKKPEEASSKEKHRVSLLRVRAKNTIQTRANRRDETPRPMSIRPPPQTCPLAISQHWRPRQMTSSFPLTLSPVRAVLLQISVPKRTASHPPPDDPGSRPEIRLGNGANRIEDVTACFPPSLIRSHLV